MSGIGMADAASQDGDDELGNTAPQRGDGRASGVTPYSLELISPVYQL